MHIISEVVTIGNNIDKYGFYIAVYVTNLLAEGFYVMYEIASIPMLANLDGNIQCF